jgi:EAL domain-containing protein (putative c-di-GMP-specific phosphodiesterase class I)
MGLEALIRWRHPKRGLLPPVELFLYRRIGFDHPIGKWWLNEACRQLKNWQDVFSNWRLLFFMLMFRANSSRSQISLMSFWMPYKPTGLIPGI